METAITYLTGLGWKISSDPRNYKGYPKNYGYRNYIENGINYDAFCGGYHRAYDFYNNTTNKIPAVTAGTVITAEKRGNFGGTVEVRDANGNDWIYGHLQRDSITLSVGDVVQQGNLIGLQGHSNYYDNPMNDHLHLQLRPKGTDLNNEVAEVCSGMDMAKYDISNLKNMKAGNKMEVIEKTITGYKMPARVGKVLGVVIHNDAGTYTAKQYYNSLLNAPYSRLSAGIAHYYIDRFTNWRAIDTFSQAWHTANNTGNNSYLGYEVCQSMSATDADFKENEEAVFKQAAEDLKYYKLPVNRNTVKLHMEFVPTACPHRSMKLHTGFDPVKSGRPSQAVMNKLKDYFIERITFYYNGGKIEKPTTTATKQKAPAKTKPATHKVVEGDTIYSIAKKYGITHKKLVELNNGIKDSNYKDNTLLKVGTVLKLK